MTQMFCPFITDFITEEVEFDECLKEIKNSLILDDERVFVSLSCFVKHYLDIVPLYL
jgi:hypothetical protein